MSDINFDEILEVPDTPDQHQSKYHVSSSIVGRDYTMAAANPSPRRKLRIRFKNNSLDGSSSQNNACSVLPAASDTDHIFKQAKAAQVLELSKDYNAKFSLKKSDRTGISVDNEKRAEKHGLDQSRSISNNISCSVTVGRNPTFQVKDGEVVQQDAGHQNANFLGIGSGLPTIPVGKPGNRTCTSTTKGVTGADVCLGSSSGEVKGEVITDKVITGPTSPLCVVPRRHVGQKRLVRNGCISPSNIAKTNVKVDAKREMCSSSEHLHHPHPQLDAFDRSSVIDLTDNSPIMTRQRSKVNNKFIPGHNMDTRATKKLRTETTGRTSVPLSKYHANSSNCSEANLSGHNNKGKGISIDILDSDQIGEADLRGVDLSTAGTCVNKNSSDINTEQGWRTTHNHTSKLPISFMGNTTTSSRREPGSSTRSNQNHGSAGGNHTSVSGATMMVPDRLGNKTIMNHKGWRKETSTSCHTGESSSAVDEPRGSLQSSKISAGRNHTSHQHNIPVITIDDISPEARPSSSGFTNGTSVDPNIEAQLESDELLARQLQEQLYNESPRFAPTEEIDAIVAMSLQHEEDAHRTSRPVRRFQNNIRDARAARSSSYRNALRARLATADDMISRLRNTAPRTLGLVFILPCPFLFLL